MTPELGQLALILALLLALAQSILPLLGAWRANRALLSQRNHQAAATPAMLHFRCRALAHDPEKWGPVFG